MLYNAVKISNIFKLLVELPFRDIRLNFFDFSYRAGQPRVYSGTINKNSNMLSQTELS